MGSWLHVHLVFIFIPFSWFSWEFSALCHVPSVSLPLSPQLWAGTPQLWFPCDQTSIPFRYPQTRSHLLAGVPSSLLHYCPKTLENKKHPLAITLMKYLEGKELSVYAPVASLMGVSFSLHKEIMNRKHYLFILINPPVYCHNKH